MPMTVKNEDGTETEAYTAEELKAAETAAADVVKTEAQKQLIEKETEIKKLQEKDTNFSKFKTETEKEKEAREAEIKKLQGDVDGLRGTMVGNFKGELLKQYAGTDVDLAKKIEDEYKTFAGEATTNEEIAARMEKAAKLLGVEPAHSVTGAAFSALGNRGIDVGKENVIPDDVKEVGAKMGISEEDYKKYGPKVK